VALYIVLYGGYTIYEKLVLGRRGQYLVPVKDVDLITDAVWGPGDGDVVRARDKKEHDEHLLSESRPGVARVKLWIARYVN